MSRRLINRNLPPDAASSPARGQSVSNPPLPEYQPPSCPLSEAGRRALGELSNNRGTSVYETQLKESARNLGLCVGDLHERLVARLDRLRSLRERREEKGSEKTAEEERLATHVEELETQVNELTKESEESLRDVIDHQAELQDQIVVLGDLYTSAATAGAGTATNACESRRRARRQGDAAQSMPSADDQDQKETPVPVPSTSDAYRAARAQKQAEYDALTPYQRYALNNDYAAFKKIWHDAAGEDGPPLPDATRWFRADGRPVMSRPGGISSSRSTIGGGGGADNVGEDNDDDDDIAVAREVISLNCPLTLRQMDEPYSHVQCKHTFEKSAILEYLPASGSVECPQSGCNQKMSKARFAQDFVLDEAKLRRIQRTKQSQRSIDDDDDDDEDSYGNDETGDQSIAFEHETQVAGRRMKREGK